MQRIEEQKRRGLERLLGGLMKRGLDRTRTRTNSNRRLKHVEKRKREKEKKRKREKEKKRKVLFTLCKCLGMALDGNLLACLLARG